jgi:hypothetical protein
MFLACINYLTQLDMGFSVLHYLTLRAILAMLSSLFQDGMLSVEPRRGIMSDEEL